MKTLRLVKEVSNTRKTTISTNRKNLMIRLPKDFTDYLKWRKGDYVGLKVTSRNTLEIIRLVGEEAR